MDSDRERPGGSGDGFDSRLTRRGALRWGLNSGLALSLAGVVSACGDSSGSASGGGGGGGGGTQTVKIGGILALTGGAAAYAQATQRGAQAAIDDINAKGGVKSGNTVYKLAWEAQDDQTDPTRTITNLKQMAGRGTKFFVGPTSGSSATAVLSVADTTDALVTFIGGPATEANLRPHGTVFQTQTSGEDLAIATAWFLGQKQMYKTVAVIADQTSTTQSSDFRLAFEKAAQKNGFKITTTQYTQGNKQTDFGPQLLAANKTNPDAVVFAQQYQSTAQLVKQAKQLGYKWTMISSAGAAKEEADVAGDSINGTYDLTGVTLETLITNGNAQAKQIGDAFKTKYNEDLQDLAGVFSNTYTAVAAYALAIQAAGTASDVKKLQTAMKGIKLSAMPSIAQDKYIPQNGASALLFDDAKAAKAKMTIVVWAGGKPTVSTTYTGQ